MAVYEGISPMYRAQAQAQADKEKAEKDLELVVCSDGSIARELRNER